MFILPFYFYYTQYLKLIKIKFIRLDKNYEIFISFKESLNKILP